LSRPGHGFARLVTIQTLHKFRRVLIPPGVPQEQYRKPRQTKERTSEDREVDKLFGGQSLKTPNPFKRSQRRYSRRGARGTTRHGAARQRPPRRSGNEVLITEIPRASTRWGQANFKKVDFEEFFRADRASRLTLTNVRNNGTQGAPEVHPKVSVKSHNFRIELRAARGRRYPAVGRPIGAFTGRGDTQFHYMLLMPGSAHHRRAANILARHSTEPANRMKRVRLPVEQVRAEWSRSPLWNFAGR
jgi:hypothetical protein